MSIDRDELEDFVDEYDGIIKGFNGDMLSIEKAIPKAKDDKTIKKLKQDFEKIKDAKEDYIDENEKQYEEANEFLKESSFDIGLTESELKDYLEDTIDESFVGGEAPDWMYIDRDRTIKEIMRDYTEIDYAGEAYYFIA